MMAILEIIKMDISMWIHTLLPFIAVIVCGAIAVIIAHYELEIRESLRQINIVMLECLTEILKFKLENILNIAEEIANFWFDLLKILIIIGAITIVAEHANDSALNNLKVVSYIFLWIFFFAKLSKAMLFIASKTPETIKRTFALNKIEEKIDKTKSEEDVLIRKKIIFIYRLLLIQLFLFMLSTVGVFYVDKAWTNVIDVAIKISSHK